MLPTCVLHICVSLCVVRRFDLDSIPVMPTWVPYMSTRADQGQLEFSLRLMTGTYIFSPVPICVCLHVYIRVYLFKMVAPMVSCLHNVFKWLIKDFVFDIG